MQAASYQKNNYALEVLVTVGIRARIANFDGAQGTVQCPQRLFIQPCCLRARAAMR